MRTCGANAGREVDGKGHALARRETARLGKSGVKLLQLRLVLRL